MLHFGALGLRMNSTLPSSLLLFLFFLPFTWGRHRRARATAAALSEASSQYLHLFLYAVWEQSTRGCAQHQKSRCQIFAKNVTAFKCKS
jgi:hypothetical protein